MSMLIDCDLGPEFPRCIPDASPDDVPREQHDDAEELMGVALAEVGYGDYSSFWDGNAYARERPVPWQILYRARELVFLRLGWSYHWEDAPTHADLPKSPEGL